MLSSLPPQEFVAKGRKIGLEEGSASQSHFNDLCRLVGHPIPIEDDPTGKRFGFEAGTSKSPGGPGWPKAWADQQESEAVIPLGSNERVL